MTGLTDLGRAADHLGVPAGPPASGLTELGRAAAAAADLQARAAGLSSDELAAEGRRLLEAEQEHTLSWDCPRNCGTQITVTRRIGLLERGAVQLARTIGRHVCPAADL